MNIFLLFFSFLRTMWKTFFCKCCCLVMPKWSEKLWFRFVFFFFPITLLLLPPFGHASYAYHSLEYGKWAIKQDKDKEIMVFAFVHPCSAPQSFCCLNSSLLCRYVFARPAGKRCFVVSSNGTTVSRLRNGSLLHRFPSALPSGARTKGSSCSAQSYCILDCIFHEVIHESYYFETIDSSWSLFLLSLCSICNVDVILWSWLAVGSNLLCDRHGLLGGILSLWMHCRVQIFLVE